MRADQQNCVYIHHSPKVINKKTVPTVKMSKKGILHRECNSHLHLCLMLLGPPIQINCSTMLALCMLIVSPTYLNIVSVVHTYYYDIGKDLTSRKHVLHILMHSIYYQIILYIPTILGNDTVYRMDVGFEHILIIH